MTNKDKKEEKEIEKDELENVSEEMMDERNAKTFIVAGVLLEKDGKYLLIQEAQKKAYGLWNFPAGKVEEGMTIETAIKKQKESGFDVELMNKVGSFQEESTRPVKNIFQQGLWWQQIENSRDISNKVVY
jgi:ADP-ribose pyrophosphatase YjhB (NUDIX family)